ncbi:MAG: divalent metal cation transporter [Dehalococcoidia bacterium]|nr:divalent metal cation transporter [Dehalococcoidia bacterium]
MTTPSGISTYTVIGATSGYQLLWTSPVPLPLNVAVQSICARIGIVTGRGLGATIRISSAGGCSIRSSPCC